MRAGTMIWAQNSNKGVFSLEVEDLVISNRKNKKTSKKDSASDVQSITVEEALL